MTATPSEAKRAVPSDHLPTLDGWRAVAVGAVIFHHFGWSHGVFDSGWLRPFVEQGKYGVDLFFAISGFLITHRLFIEHQRAGKVSFRGFYVRRFFRIIPPALLCLGFMATAPVPSFHPPLRSEWLGCLFFYRNYVAGGLLITGHFWSLCVEEHYYLFWPAAFSIAAVRRRIWILPLLAVAVAVWRVLVLADRIPEALMSASEQDFRTDVRIDALLWGAWFAIALRDERRRAWLVRNLKLPMWLGAVVAFFGSGFFRPEIAMTVKALVAPGIIVGTVYRPDWLVSRFLELRPLRFIGSISYGLYLFQQTFLPYDLLRFVLIVPTAWLSFVLLERPMMDLGRTLLRGRSGPPTMRPRALRLLPAAALAIGSLGVFVFVAARVATNGGVLEGPVVEVYGDLGLQGIERTLGAGGHVFPPSGDGALGISSLRVGSGASARICTEERGGRGTGRCHLFHPGTVVNYVGDPFNDRIAVVEVVAN